MKKGSFRNFKNGFETVNGGQDAPAGAKKPAGKIAAAVILVIAALFLAANSAYEIKE